MIRLYQFPSCWNLPNASPFCMKLETYLRMTNLPFEIVSVHDPRRAPKGKFPFIKDDGVVIADSGLIIDYLKKRYGDVLDAHLTALQKAQMLAWQRLMEEHLYWIVLYSRWIDPVNWPVTKNAFFPHLSPFKLALITYFVQKNMRAQLNGHGIGRHSQAEIYQLGLDDLQALNTALNNQAYFMGEQPSSIDACVYAYLANILQAPVISPMTDYAKAQKNFVDYCARMKGRYYA